MHNTGLLPANQALAHYFDDLTQDFAQDDPNALAHEEKLNQAERLLARANSISSLINDSFATATESVGLQSIDYDEALVTCSTENIQSDPSLQNERNLHKGNHSQISLRDSLPNQFQVLLCDVAGVTIALPLVELGGIQKLTKITKIAKKPSWFMGVMLKGDEKLNCIDASAWIRPERYASQQNAQTNYQFAVQLGKTPYALCCDGVSTTLALSKDDIKWRENTKNTPWLVGLLKENMCALIDGAKMVQNVLIKLD